MGGGSMYCVSCGKANPDGAAFCAFCGKPMAVSVEAIEAELMPEEPVLESEPWEAPAAPAEVPEAAAPEAEVPEAHEPFRRPDPSRQVKPLGDNPAQPSRGARSAPDLNPDRTASVERRVNRAARSNGRMQEPPARKAPIAPKKKAGWTAPSTLVPKRKKRGGDDLFFEDIERPGERPYDELDDEVDWNRRIKSGVAAAFLLVVLGFVFWLLVMPGGQMLRAGMGWGGSAAGYAALGDRYLSENSVRRAADAYYEALRMEPENYDFMLKVAKTQALVGDREKALTAYLKCITLRESAWEPYKAVSELYEQMGDKDRALNALKIGYDKTGRLDLFRAYEALQQRVEEG